MGKGILTPLGEIQIYIDKRFGGFAAKATCSADMEIKKGG